VLANLFKKKPPPIRSLIGEGVAMRGSLKFMDGLRIDGEVHGDVEAANADDRSLIVISENARVFGKVKASHVIINGQVHGPVHCDDLLELQPKARVVGDVRYALLEMHPGAMVEGELKPLGGTFVADKPALKLAASNDA
jgi:cytoskeletal protein CcmA (bactofilin family)